MNKSRLLWTIMSLIKGKSKRVAYLRKHGIFGSIGENCAIADWRLPLYPNLVFMHNNVRLASEVRFVTHDGIHNVLNRKYGTNDFVERVGIIEIGDNVFVGSGTRILYNIRIGSNVIIGSDSLVNKDIPGNSVYAGVPARYICSFEEYVEKARKYSEKVRLMYDIKKLTPMNKDLASKIYENFVEEKKIKEKGIDR